MEYKTKNLKISLVTSKKVADISICISIPFPDVAECCLKKLSCNCTEEGGLMKGSEKAALAYALFETVRDKLVGSALEIAKTRVGNVSCFTIGNYFNIRVNTQGTSTNLRKVCGIVLSCFHPEKFFSKYSENIRFLSGKPGQKPEFNYCAKEMITAIKSGINVVVAGKIKIDKNKLKEIGDSVFNKLPSHENIKDTKVPESKAVESESSYPLIKCSGISLAGIADYVRNNSNGMSIEITKKGLLVYNTTSKLDQIKDKNRITEYISKKYERLGDDFMPIFVYFAITQEFADSNTLEKIISAKLTPSKLKTEVLKAI